MPVTFARLRIAGFKSFAEPVSLEILPGLTGIVGPNGCGKSNVIEALRWTMGESSARSLRGAEMDDLIFAGTAARPARNLAEVVLTLEDAAGLAPPPLHDQAELQISRRIERGAGSAYRINGREARARDVQTLFADLATGARSSAMVSQGRVAAIVNARPEERRSVLEEAAGITGLHARRHEAELKLRATEANLARAEDLRAQLDDRVRSLAGQAREAGRYRTVAAQLRQSETELLALLHARATRAVSLTGTARREAIAAQQAAERALAEASETECRASAALQGPREAEAIARTLLERRRIEAENAAEQNRRAARDAEQAEGRVGQALADLEAARARQEDAEAETARLAEEQAALDAASATLPSRSADAEAGLARARADLLSAEQRARIAADGFAAARTRQAEQARDAEAAGARLDRATTLLAAIEADRIALEAALPDPAALQASEAECREAEAAGVAAELALDRAVERRGAAARAAEAARLASEDAARRQREALRAETDAAERAARLRAESEAIRTRLHEAESALVPEAERAGADERVLAAERALSAATAALDGAESARAKAVSARIEAEARRQEAGRARQQAANGLAQAGAAHERALAQYAQLSGDHHAALAAAVPEQLVARSAQARQAAQDRLASIQDGLAAAESELAEATAEAARRVEALAGLRETSGRLAAEADGLTRSLAASADPDPARPAGPGQGAPSPGAPSQSAPAPSWPALGELLEVPPGLEAAIAVCLADGLDAACVPEAPQTWLFLPDRSPGQRPALPGGATALSTLLRAPEQLGRALSQAGLIGPDSDGDALQAALSPGQCLVTRDGALWRWDGYRVAAGQPSPAAIRLQQRARLRDTLARLSVADAALPPAARDADRALARRDDAARAAQSLRQTRAPAEAALAQAREEESRLGRQEAQARARIDALAPQLARAETALAEAEAACDAARAAQGAVPDAGLLDRDCARAVRDETDSIGRERAARAARGEADAALRRARDAAAALAARHAAQESARRSLAPALDRLRDETLAADATLAQARRLLADVAPEAAALALAAAQAEADDAARTEQAARSERESARARLADRGAARDRIVAALRDGHSRRDALQARLAAAEAERDEADAALAAVSLARNGLPDAAQAAHDAEQAAAALVAARDAERDAAATLSGLAAERAALAARSALLAASRTDWQARRDIARGAVAQAEHRLAEARTEAAAHQAGPADAALLQAAIEAALDQADTAHRQSAAALDQADAVARRAQIELRTAEAALSAAREATLRAEAREEQAHAILSQFLAETPEPPDLQPDDLSDAAETALRRRVARLVRERDEIGPVNLRAELELDEANARIAAILHERDEIETAIARLRGQIGQLNREGRERLLAVFEQVDRHFQALFARMFNGGRAHLGLVGSDDPLAAGLEIYAQPPGKKLATLSLLSGGEQALTALSLVFAVFRCNPAPVCVLDEVDAPLDDANVERFCALLGDMVREAGTRFLVVTHHQLTMAHMDRLYGVTMQERGISRILSVDLAQAHAMID
jgi:chromosome segregation protein